MGNLEKTDPQSVHRESPLPLLTGTACIPRRHERLIKPRLGTNPFVMAAGI